MAQAMALECQPGWQKQVQPWAEVTVREWVWGRESAMEWLSAMELAMELATELVTELATVTELPLVEGSAASWGAPSASARVAE